MKVLALEKCGRQFVLGSPLSYNSNSKIESLNQSESTHGFPLVFLRNPQSFCDLINVHEQRVED